VVPKTPFVVPYRVRDDVLEILRVYHHARRWPGRL
jgi:toxin ParE1/3/4